MSKGEGWSARARSLVVGMSKRVRPFILRLEKTLHSPDHTLSVLSSPDESTPPPGNAAIA